MFSELAVGDDVDNSDLADIIPAPVDNRRIQTVADSVRGRRGTEGDAEEILAEVQRLEFAGTGAPPPARPDMSQADEDEPADSAPANPASGDDDSDPANAEMADFEPENPTFWLRHPMPPPVLNRYSVLPHPWCG